MRVGLIFVLCWISSSGKQHTGAPGTTWSEAKHKFVYTDIVGASTTNYPCVLLTASQAPVMWCARLAALFPDLIHGVRAAPLADTVSKIALALLYDTTRTAAKYVHLSPSKQRVSCFPARLRNLRHRPRRLRSKRNRRW
jgi:hypothetical protein